MKPVPHYFVFNVQTRVLFARDIGDNSNPTTANQDTSTI